MPPSDTIHLNAAGIRLWSSIVQGSLESCGRAFQLLRPRIASRTRAICGSTAGLRRTPSMRRARSYSSIASLGRPSRQNLPLGRR